MLPTLLGSTAQRSVIPRTIEAVITHQSQMGMNLRDSVSPLTYKSWWGSAWMHQSIKPSVSAFCFFNLDIPQGATIVEAYLELRVDAYGGTMSVWSAGTWRGIAADDIPNSLPNPTTDYTGFANRTTSASNYTSAATISTQVPPKDSRSVIIRPIVDSIIQEIVNRPGWNAGNGIQLNFIGGTSAPPDDTFAEAFIFRTNNVEPRLIIKYRSV